jgi:choline dehydrogenase
MTVNRDAGVREGAATAFYYPIQGRQNLRILNGTVTKLHLSGNKEEGQRAYAVEYVDASGETLKAAVTRRGEVILAAGTLRTPLILEASGIGDPELLHSLGIEVKVPLPGVGRNLQEQPHIALVYKAKRNSSGLTPYATFVTAEDIFGGNLDLIKTETAAIIAEWAQNIASAGAAVNANAMERILRIQHDLLFKDGVSIAEIVTSSSANRLKSSVWPLFQFSRGTVHLRSTRKEDQGLPVINPRLFALDFDRQHHIAAGKLAQTFWRKEPMAANVQCQIKPSSKDLPHNATGAQWSSFMKNNVVPSQHPIGTAAMMDKQLGGVVSPELIVYGMQNVRVVDASVIPLQTNGHLTATLYALAERASRIIRKSLEQDEGGERAEGVEIC